MFKGSSAIVPAWPAVWESVCIPALAPLYRLVLAHSCTPAWAPAWESVYTPALAHSGTLLWAHSGTAALERSDIAALVPDGKIIRIRQMLWGHQIPCLLALLWSTIS